MIAITTYDETTAEQMNHMSLEFLSDLCKRNNMKVEINNGKITGATIHHRDFVSVYDGRNNYI